MGRSPRIDAPGAWHHVMNRGAGRRITFRDDRERALFVSLLSEIESRFDVEIHAYCLMGNHYHLLLRSKSGRLSESMAWLGSRYTRWVNVERDVDGPLFRGRFHSVLVDRDAHLDWLFRYINANPLDLGWELPLADYPWSGLASTLGRGDPSPWLCTGYVRERFGDEPAELESFVEQARAEPTTLSALPRGRIVDDDIVAAVATVRGPGPVVNSDADVRAAVTYIALRTGIPLVDVTTVGELDERAAGRFAERARRRCEQSGSTRALVDRAASLLAHECQLAA